MSDEKLTEARLRAGAQEAADRLVNHTSLPEDAGLLARYVKLVGLEVKRLKSWEETLGTQARHLVQTITGQKDWSGHAVDALIIIAQRIKALRFALAMMRADLVHDPRCEVFEARDRLCTCRYAQITELLDRITPAEAPEVPG